MMDWASGDDFRDGAVGVIAIFLGFWAFFFWPHMQKRVKGPTLGVKQAPSQRREDTVKEVVVGKGEAALGEKVGDNFDKGDHGCGL